MSNTHRAVIESSVPPRLTLIAAGPEDFCRSTLAQWIKEHPLGEFEEDRVLAVEGEPGMNKQDATKAIALTLAELAGIEAPNVVAWEQAKLLADKFEAAGHIKPKPEKQDDGDMIVYGYTVVGRDGKLLRAYEGSTQQEAIDFAAEWTKDCQDAGIDWDYKVAAIVDQGGL